jgi:hypothetical protein
VRLPAIHAGGDDPKADEVVVALSPVIAAQSLPVE